MHVIATYGTLRKDQGNYERILRHAEFLGTGRTIGNGYTMYSFGGFPAVAELGDNQITVDLFAVDDDTLARCDRLEGHPQWYERKKIQTSLGEAWMYLMPYNQIHDNSPVIKSGDWIDYKAA